MNRIVHNPVVRVVMAVLVVFLSWPCAGGCEESQLPGAIHRSDRVSAPGPAFSTVVDDCGTCGELRDCGCPCLSDAVKVRAERPLFAPAISLGQALVLLPLPEPSATLPSFEDPVQPPTPRFVALFNGLRAPPSV